MSGYSGRRNFRSGRGMRLAIVLTTLLFLAGAVMTYRLQGWTWVSIAFACGTLFCIAGIVEALLIRVQLTEESLVVRDLRGRRSYRRDDITRVEEGKGGPTSIQLMSDRWVKLPPVGSSLGNSIRAWLKHR